MIHDSVIQLIVDVLQLGDLSVDGERSLAAYGMDSARAMELVIAIEDSFQVDIPDDVLIHFKTANDIIRAVERLRPC